MIKKIKIIILIYNLLIILMTFVGMILVLNELDVINVGGKNKSSTSSGGVVSAEVEEVMAMSDEDVWKGLTGGLLTSLPDSKAPSNASEIEAAVRKQIVSITVPIRVWENSGDSSNMNTVKKEQTLEVNSLLADLWTAFFNDIYNEASDFVIVSVGCFRIDGTGYGQIGFKSAHTYGAAVDINAYDDGNPYGSMAPYSKSEWSSLPENHLKYQIIYTDSKVVEIAHKYTLLWGGDWSGGTYDLMHFSFIADGSSRAERQQQFGNK